MIQSDKLNQSNHYVSKVYTGFIAMLGLSTMGVLVSMLLNLSNFVTIMCGLSSILVIFAVFYNLSEGNFKLMEKLVYFDSFLLGMSTVPLIRQVCDLDPSLIFGGFMGTTLVFSSVTIYIHLWNPFEANDDLQYYFGQILFTWLNLTLILLLVNTFLNSDTLHLFELYTSLMLFTLFVGYDTSVIIQKYRYPPVVNEAYVLDSLNLFLDFSNMFVRILQILYQLKDGNKKSKKK